MVFRFLFRTALMWIAGRILGRFLPGLRGGARLFRFL